MFELRADGWYRDGEKIKSTGIQMDAEDVKRLHDQATQKETRTGEVLFAKAKQNVTICEPKASQMLARPKAMIKFRKATDFKIQTRADKVKPEFQHLPIWTLKWEKQGKEDKFRLVPTPAHHFNLKMPGWKRQPRLVLVKSYYYEAYDYAIGLRLPRCFGKTREEAVAATYEKLKQVGEDRYWKLQEVNAGILRKAGARPNGEHEKPKPVDVPDFNATQLTLL